MSLSFKKRPYGGDGKYRHRYGQHKTPGLTARQIEILTMIAEGLCGKEIAWKLGISTQSYDYHRGMLCDIFNTRNIATLTKIAVGFGLVRL